MAAPRGPRDQTNEGNGWSSVAGHQGHRHHVGHLGEAATQAVADLVPWPTARAPVVVWPSDLNGRNSVGDERRSVTMERVNIAVTSEVMWS